MPTESWLVLTVAAAFLLLGIAGSPLAWALIHLRRSRFEERMELRWRELADRMLFVGQRLEQLGATSLKEGQQSRTVPMKLAGHGSVTPTEANLGGQARWSARTVPGAGLPRNLTTRADAVLSPPLIAVPNLQSEPSDGEANVSGLKDRYAAIWALADTGATSDVIARATGLPVGQLELILGLRRQIDGNKTNSAHRKHT